MIYKISEAGKSMTTWTDTIESLVKATHEAAFSKREIFEVASDTGRSIKKDRFGWYTDDPEIIAEAKRQGYQIETDENFGKELARTYILLFNQKKVK